MPRRPRLTARLARALLALTAALSALASAAHAAPPPPPQAAPPQAAEAPVDAPAAQAADAPPRSLREALATPEDDLDGLDALLAGPAGPGISLGTTSSGAIKNAITIPLEGERLAVLPTHCSRDRNHAAHALAQLLDDVAAELAATHPGARLWLGDISAREGGPISRHSSHRCGRDADVAFFYVDAEGRPADPQRFVDLDALGRSADGTLRFDVERSWAMVRAMLEHPSGVQYIFIYDPLKALLLEHGRRTGAPEALLTRARWLLHQPSDSSPHSDHIHVRVVCSARDRLAGCVNRGPRWPWAELHDDVIAARADALLAYLPGADAATRARILDHLIALRATEATPSLVALLPALDVVERDAVLAAVAQLGAAPEAGVALAAALPHLAGDARLAALALIGQAGAPATLGTLRGELADALAAGDGERARVALLATTQLDQRAAIPIWLAVLDVPSPEVRAVALDALQRQANRMGPPVDLRAADDAALARVAADWRGWWRDHRDEPRDRWLLDGFNAVGADLADLDDLDAVPALIDALTAQPAPIADNAHALLTRVTGKWFSPALEPAERRARWRDWWSQNASALRASADP